MTEMTAEEENEIRNLRDKVYGVPTSFKNWEACKENWMKKSETDFLEEQTARIKTPCQSSSLNQQ